MRPAVDRSFVRMVAYKRLFTGIAGLVGAAILTYLALTQGRRPTLLFGVGVLLFAGGGAWALRDALRLLKLLRDS